jgi:O-antigen ligase
LNLILNAGVFAMQAPGGFMGQQFAGIYDNSNFCATVLFLTSFFLMLEYKASGSRMALFMIACSIMMMIFTGSRAVLLALIIALAANALPHAARRRLYWPTLGLIGVFIYVYLYQAAHDAHALENGMVQTGKDIFTGRQVIWDHVLQLIQDAPWLGYGLGAVPATYGDVHVYDGKSIHNLYLQTWYQTGLVGLILLILTLRQKYMDLTNAGGPAQLAGAYLIGILVIQTFEVDLTQNNFAAALGMWLIITSGGTTVEQARALPGRRRLRSWAEVEWGRGYEERIHRSGTYENSAVIRRMQSAYHQVGKRFGG